MIDIRHRPTVMGLVGIVACALTAALTYAPWALSQVQWIKEKGRAAIQPRHAFVGPMARYRLTREPKDLARPSPSTIDDEDAIAARQIEIGGGATVGSSGPLARLLEF